MAKNERAAGLYLSQNCQAAACYIYPLGYNCVLLICLFIRDRSALDDLCQAVIMIRCFNPHSAKNLNGIWLEYSHLRHFHTKKTKMVIVVYRIGVAN